MGYREATCEEKHNFTKVALIISGYDRGELEIDEKHRRLIKRQSLEGENNIGGLGEKTMHLAFKYFFEPNSAYHEIKIGRHYADIMRDGAVTEIQTKNFCSFRKKLAAVSEKYPVTVVHPIISTNRLYTVDRDTGERSRGRISPVHESIYTVFEELVYIRELLGRESLSFVFPVIECESYRISFDKSKKRKLGSVHYDTIPTNLVGFYEFDSAFAFAQLLPYTEETLTVKKVAELIGNKRSASAFVNVLMYLDILCKDGKVGKANRYIYGENY